MRGQVDHFVVLKGAFKIYVYDDNTGELDEIVSTSYDPQIVKIPGIYWHGFKVISNVNKLYDYEKPDEERRPWNDQTIIPKSINRRTDDPRVGKLWDWNYPPHR